jgi:hypothetical protein
MRHLQHAPWYRHNPVQWHGDGHVVVVEVAPSNNIAVYNTPINEELVRNLQGGVRWEATNFGQPLSLNRSLPMVPQHQKH